MPLRILICSVLALGMLSCSAPTKPPVPPTIVSFTASSSTLPFGGGQVVLKWVQRGATGLAIDQGVGSVNSRTETTVQVTQTTTFTLTATNVAGSAQSSVTVTVEDPTEPPEITAFSATPPNIGNLRGGTTKLRWTAPRATSLSIDHGVGDVSTLIEIDVNVTMTTVFTLTATNVLGSVTAQTTVTVYVPTAPPVISSFTAAPASLPAGGGLVRLSWTVSDYQTLTIDQGVGSVVDRTFVDVLVTTTTAFRLVATNVRGTAQAIVLITVAP